MAKMTLDMHVSRFDIMRLLCPSAPVGQVPESYLATLYPARAQCEAVYRTLDQTYLPLSGPQTNATDALARSIHELLLFLNPLAYTSIASTGVDNEYHATAMSDAMDALEFLDTCWRARYGYWLPAYTDPQIPVGNKLVSNVARFLHLVEAECEAFYTPQPAPGYEASNNTQWVQPMVRPFMRRYQALQKALADCSG